MNMLELRLSIFLVTLFLSVCVYGQEEKVNLSVDLANNFVWRGSATNTTPVIQPSVTFLPERTVSFGLWANTPITPTKNKVHELDIFIDVQITSFLTFNVTNYFVTEDGTPGYFNFNKDTTGHSVDAQLIFAPENFPLTMTFSTILLGNDLNDKGKNNYSSYIEAAYIIQGKHLDWEMFVGMTPFKSLNYYEVDKINIINIGLGVYRTFEIGNYNLPLSAKLFVNPTHRKVFFTVSANIFNSGIHRR